MSALLVNIACGSVFVDGWVNLDYAPASPAVTRANLLERLPVNDAAAIVVYSSHFIEHIPRKRVSGFLEECYRILQPRGQIRLVLPDLDELCREYLCRRDAGEHARADFVALEMLDQCVRTEPGGELGSLYKSMPAGCAGDMAAYIAARTGEDLSGATGAAHDSGRRLLLEAFRHPSRICGRLERWYCRAMTLLLPSAFLEQNVSFADVGERHAWIYDFHTLSRMLEQAGFASVRKVRFDLSGIERFPLNPLDVNTAGLPRKGLGSMYVEASKP